MSQAARVGAAERTATFSGTSMAAPHVAGAAGLLLSRGGTGSSGSIEATLKANVISAGTASKDGRPIRIVNAGRH